MASTVSLIESSADQATAFESGSISTWTDGEVALCAVFVLNLRIIPDVYDVPVDGARLAIEWIGNTQRIFDFATP